MDLIPEALTPDAFAPYGAVIQVGTTVPLIINEGFAQRFDDLARVPVGADGEAKLSLFCAEPRPLPITLSLMERHPLGAQAFQPLTPSPWLVVVADPADDGDAPGRLRAFLARGDQGVVYRPGVWHHPLLVFLPGSRFLVVDRAGPGTNCDEVRLPDRGDAAVRLRLDLPPPMPPE